MYVGLRERKRSNPYIAEYRRATERYAKIIVSKEVEHVYFNAVLR